MSFEEFEHLARLYVVDSLDDEETGEFETARQELGQRAEDYIQECRRLNAAFALSLRPHPPREDAKERLMEMIRKSMRNGGVGMLVW